jgi:hypothetical protein
MSGHFAVYFKAGCCDMDAAVRALTRCDLTVSPQDGYVIVSRSGSPEFDVGLSTEPWVRQEAAGIAGSSPDAAALAECDARFEVSTENLQAALQEINTMMEIQVALQVACNGIVFLPWNRRVMSSDS